MLIYNHFSSNQQEETTKSAKVSTGPI